VDLPGNTVGTAIGTSPGRRDADNLITHPVIFFHREEMPGGKGNGIKVSDRLPVGVTDNFSFFIPIGNPCNLFQALIFPNLLTEFSYSFLPFSPHHNIEFRTLLERLPVSETEMGPPGQSYDARVYLFFNPLKNGKRPGTHRGLPPGPDKVWSKTPHPFYNLIKRDIFRSRINNPDFNTILLKDRCNIGQAQVRGEMHL
jgi:hypothetical protein